MRFNQKDKVKHISIQPQFDIGVPVVRRKVIAQVSQPAPVVKSLPLLQAGEFWRMMPLLGSSAVAYVAGGAA